MFTWIKMCVNKGWNPFPIFSRRPHSRPRWTNSSLLNFSLLVFMMIRPSAGILMLYCFLKEVCKCVTDDSVHLCPAYVVVSSILLLLSTRTLRRYLRPVNCKPEIFNERDKTSRGWFVEGKHSAECVLIFDEMSLRQSKCWNPAAYTASEVS
jgi:hypothetical protein